MPRILFSLIFPLLFLASYAQKGNDSSASVKHHNKIDDINTAFQIENLLKETDKRYSNFHVTMKVSADSNCERLSDSLHAVPFFKADFDNNGYTDLIVIGSWYEFPSVICLLDSGKENPTIVRLTKRVFTECSFPVLSAAGPVPTIDFYYFRQYHLKDSDSSNIIRHTLIFKYGDFIEYNPAPTDYKIEKIEYSTTRCFGTCPVFKMAIDSGREAVYEAIVFNAQKSGKYRTRIDQETYLLLKNLLNYTNFPMLKDSYNVSWTDDQTCILNITYDNGKVKTIRDYGLCATFGLNQVYNILFDLRDSQSWK